ncbi:MAG: VOC family protein [Cyclobacteriaceae bacterium]
MLKNANTFNSFSTNDLEASKIFYQEILGLHVIESEMGVLEIKAGGSNKFVIYPRGDDHQAAKYTVLNFEVKHIEEVVDHLNAKGITFEQYDEPTQTDEKGIHHGSVGPKIAWFKDPAGNILSVFEEK